MNEKDKLCEGVFSTHLKSKPIHPAVILSCCPIRGVAVARICTVDLVQQDGPFISLSQTTLE